MIGVRGICRTRRDKKLFLKEKFRVFQPHFTKEARKPKAKRLISR